MGRPKADPCPRTGRSVTPCSRNLAESLIAPPGTRSAHILGVPSPVHEALVDLFDRSPALLQPLVGKRLRALSPGKRFGFTTDHTRVSELRLADSDLVLKVFTRSGKLRLAIIFEVQLGKDPRKARAWPLYAAWVHQRLGCEVHVVVLTVDRKVAAWAAGPFGPRDARLRTWVIGPEHIPPITSFAEACAAPDLTFLSALAHAKEPIVIHIARALWHALDRKRHLYADRYWDILMSQLYTAIRRSLEMELQGWKPQSPWGKRIFADGVTKGKALGLAEGVAKGEAKGVAKGVAKGIAKGKALGLAEGQATGRAEALLTFLRTRGIALTRAERTAIRTCRDPRRLQAWLRRAYTVETAAELFEPRRRAR
jgi:hypothetical protein